MFFYGKNSTFAHKILSSKDLRHRFLRSSVLKVLFDEKESLFKCINNKVSLQK